MKIYVSVPKFPAVNTKVIGNLDIASKQLEISVEGYSSKGDGPFAILGLNDKGHLILSVWADNQNAGPSHIINLEGARKDTPVE